jgi:hypothetical protein
VIIRITIISLGETTESPSIRLTNEGGELGMFKVFREDVAFELTGFEDAPRAAVGCPGYDVVQFGIG